MRYDDIEAHKSLVSDNVELVELVKEAQKQINSENLHIYKKNKGLVDKLEILSKNIKNSFNCPSLKMMAIFISIGLFFGAFSVGGYTYFVLKNNIKIKKVPIIKTETIKVKNPINKDLKTQIKNLKTRIKNLKTKVLPAKYYYVRSDGSQYIRIKTNDPRFSSDDSNKAYIIDYIHLLK